MRWPAPAVLAGLLAMAGMAIAQAAVAQTDPRAVPTLTVHLTSFAFTPSHIVLPANTPVRLILDNDSNGRHDFSAPSLFAASTFPGGAPPADGRIDLQRKQRTAIVFVPRAPGTYSFRCTHFLHSFFGMHGSVVVEGPKG